MDDVAGGTPDELRPGGDVAPLVLSTGLEGASIALVQFLEVQRLQQDVAELAERDA